VFDGPQEYIRARHLFCSLCNGRGASIGCSVTTCNNSVHFPCAIKASIPENSALNTAETLFASLRLCLF
ncbi:unnamed protein product, partial [Hapterophycus canaliculatus]